MPEAAAAIWPWFQSLVNWTKEQEGLGIWLGAFGTILAIFAAWLLARAEYQRTRRNEKARRAETIDALKDLIARFQASLRQYVDLIRRGDVAEASRYEATHENDPAHLAAADLASAAITFWPSLGTYMRFKEYWACSRELLSLATVTGPEADPQYAERVHPKLTECVQKCNELIKSLDAAK